MHSCSQEVVDPDGQKKKEGPITKYSIYHGRMRYRLKQLRFRRTLVPINDLLREWDQRITPNARGS